jgi:hypothetical protein
MLAQVLIAEADSFVAMWKDLKLPDGRGRVVRHGQRIEALRPPRPLRQDGEVCLQGLSVIVGQACARSAAEIEMKFDPQGSPNRAVRVR